MKLFITSLTALALSGCATKFDTDKIPSKGYVKDLTTYYQSDFVSGKPKTISDYDFFYEDSPCSAMPSRKVPPVYKEQVFEVELSSGHRVFFECRNSGLNNSSLTFRLFLIGSRRECQSRTFDYTKSFDNVYQRRGIFARPQPLLGQNW